MNQKQKFINVIFEKAQAAPARILYPEADLDERVWLAASKPPNLAWHTQFFMGMQRR